MTIFNFSAAVMALSIALAGQIAFGDTTTDTAGTTCLSPCAPPSVTITQVAGTLITGGCRELTISTAPTVTCSDHIATTTETLTKDPDCPPPTTVTITRCPATTLRRMTVFAPPECYTPTPVTECPDATSTFTTTTVTTVGNCNPIQFTTLLPTTTQSLPTCTVTTTTTPTPSLIAKWWQCGGNAWIGPTQCVPGTTCTVINVYYSHCQ